MSFLSNITDRFVVTPLAKRMTQIISSQNPIEKADKPSQFAVPYGFNSQSIDSERRQMGSSVSVVTLRQLSVSHETTRAAINIRKRQINQLTWDIIDSNLEGGASYSDEERMEIKKQFQAIGGPGQRFSQLIDKLIEDTLVLDAFCFYKQTTRGNKLLRIIPIDGATIKMRVDEVGMRPLPPEIAFEQWIRGEKVAEMTTNEMVYESMNPRSNSAFGLSPLETLVMTIHMALQASIYNSNYLSDNNLPPGFLTMPPEWTTQQIKEYKEFFDAAMSGSKAQSRIFTIPSGATYTTVSKPKDFQFKDFFDYLDRKVAMLFDITPQELGLSLQQYKENAESQEIIGMRKGLKPLAKFIEEIFTDLIQNDLGHEDLAFRFKGLDSKYTNEDAKTLIPIGVISIDDVRLDRGEKPLGVDPFVMTGAGPLPVNMIGKQAQLATQSGNETPQPTKKDEPVAPIEPPTTTQKKQMSLMDELKAWQAKALNDIRKKGKVYREFVANELPIDQQKFIRQELAKASTIDDVHVVFKGKKIRRNKGLEALEGNKKFKMFRSSIRAGILNSIAPFTKPETISQIVGTEKLHKSLDDLGEYFDSIEIEGFNDYLQWAAEQGGQQAYNALGIKGSFSLTNEQFKEMLGNRENYLIDSVDETTRNWLIEQIRQGKVEGLTNDEIAERIAEADDDFTDSRADVIVNTEVANALQTSELDTYQEQGIEKKRWVASDDDLVDPICQDLDGEVADVEDEFSSGDDAPPAHPNCRCYIQAVLNSEEIEESSKTEDLRKDWVTIHGNPVFLDGDKGVNEANSLTKPQKQKTIGQLQQEHQAKDLTSYENAFNARDNGILQALAEKYPNDSRYHIHERLTPKKEVSHRGAGESKFTPLTNVIPMSQLPREAWSDEPKDLKKDWVTINGNHILIPDGGEADNRSAADKVVDAFASIVGERGQHPSEKTRLKEGLKQPLTGKEKEAFRIQQTQEKLTPPPQKENPNESHFATIQGGKLEEATVETGGVGEKNFNLEGITQNMSQGKMNDFVNKQLDRDAPETNGAGKMFNWKLYNVGVDQITKGVAGDPNLVNKYMKDMKDGAKFPLIKAVRLEGKPEIIDGLHRYEAAVNSGAKTIPMFIGSPKG